MAFLGGCVCGVAGTVIVLALWCAWAYAFGSDK